jgi:hypothetical protein
MLPLNSPRKPVTFGNRRLSPRNEFRLRRNEEVKNSPTLAEKFPRLKSLRLTVDYFDATGKTRSGGMKYDVNLGHGRSLFCFNCINSDCSGGDYDLSGQLAEAIAARLKVVTSELRCQGTRRNADRKINRPCLSILRYKLALGY